MSKDGNDIVPSCESCICFVEVQSPIGEIGSGKRGECRRFPPQIVSVIDRGRAVQGAGFPQVPGKAWCAEWRTPQGNAKTGN